MIRFFVLCSLALSMCACNKPQEATAAADTVDADLPVDSTATDAPADVTLAADATETKP